MLSLLAPRYYSISSSPSADPTRVLKQVDEMIGLVDTSHAVLCSAKSGIGIDEILEAVVKYFPPPKDADTEPLRALIFDSWYDPYQGVVALCRIMEGRVKKGTKIRLFHVNKEFEVQLEEIYPQPGCKLVYCASMPKSTRF